MGTGTEKAKPARHNETLLQSSEDAQRDGNAPFWTTYEIERVGGAREPTLAA